MNKTDRVPCHISGCGRDANEITDDGLLICWDCWFEIDYVRAYANWPTNEPTRTVWARLPIVGRLFQ